MESSKSNDANTQTKINKKKKKICILTNNEVGNIHEYIVKYIIIFTLTQNNIEDKYNLSNVSVHYNGDISVRHYFAAVMCTTHWRFKRKNIFN